MALQFFEKELRFSENFIKVKVLKRSKIPVIVTKKHLYLSNGGLLRKYQVPFLRRTHEFKKPLISVYLMNHIFQKSAFFNMWQ